ncbi:MAG: gamma-butyrobetaine hydroxylase-like domain-containing protein [Bacteroidota bacterium]
MPVIIKRDGKSGVVVRWNDSHESRYTLELLRDICPCAECSGETVLLHSYVPPSPDRSTPGRYELKNIRVVGTYAMQPDWGDGHSTGIYSWEYLLKHCPCPVHRGDQQLS